MQRDLSFSYNKLGDIAKARNDYKAAEGYYAKALEIGERLAEKYPEDPQMQRDLSISYNNLGDIAKAQKNHKATKEYYLKAIGISRKLAGKFPDDPKMQRDLSVSYNNLGGIAKALSDYRAAEGYYAKALEIREKLAKMFPGVPMLKDDLAVSLFKCGTCSADGKLSSEQKAMLRDAAAIWEELYEQTGYELYAERRKLAQNRLNQCSEQGGKNMKRKKPGFFARLREKIRAYREMRKLVRMLKIMEKTDRKLTKAIEEADELIQSGETDDEE